MRIASNKCPYCGASLVLPEDGRMSFFCSYCGNQIILEAYPGVDDLLRIKEADTRLKEARAKEYDANARLIDADVRQMRESNKVNQEKNERKAYFWVGLFLLGLSILVAGFLVLLFINDKISGEALGISVAFGCSLLFLFGIISIFCAFEKKDYDKEMRRRKVEKRIETLTEELKEQQQIVIECGIAIKGKTAEKKRYTRMRIKQLHKEIRSERIKLRYL